MIAAIRAGKPVFCEKPMATTEADCSAILDAEAAFGRRLVQIGFMRRFDTQYRAMKETVQKGAIGAPLMFHSVHRNASSPGHFKATMAITDTAVHDIDIARFVLDDEPVAIAVKAPRGNSRAGGVADPLFTLMDMRSGALVTIETSVHIAYGYDIRGEVIGETGTVSLAETERRHRQERTAPFPAVCSPTGRNGSTRPSTPSSAPGSPPPPRAAPRARARGTAMSRPPPRLPA